MPDLAAKDASVRDLLNRLESRLGNDSFLVVDHWQDDPFAIAIARPDNLKVLTYISTAIDDPKRFYIPLELSPAREWVDAPYSPAGERNVREFEELVATLRRHSSDAFV